jgi:hypothetical protein
VRNNYENFEFNLRQARNGIDEISCDYRTRTLVHNHMKNLTNNFITKDTNFSDNKLFLNLKNDGFVELGKVLDDQQINDIQQYFKDKQIYNQHVPPGDGIKRNLFDSTNRFNCYDPSEVLATPHLLELALSEKIIGIASEYLECVPTLYSINAFWTIAKNINQDGGRSDVQKFHRDYDDFKFLSFFIYVVDVDEDTSPHIFVKNTHNLDNQFDDKFIKDNLISIVGEKGSGFLLDTYGIHSGTYEMKKNRFVIWLRYGLHKNSPTQRQMPNPLNKNLIDYKNINFDEKNKFITRYIIKH